MKIVEEMTTLEMIEFLNSYNRLFAVNQKEALKYRKLYVVVFAELCERQPLIALTY